MVDVGPGQVTGAKYVEILEEVLLPTVRAMFVPEPIQFYLLHDNSPIHTARIVTQWLQEHREIIVLPHPAKSPDLNPIENVWAALTRNMPHLVNPTREDVVTASMQAWEGLRNNAGQQFVYNVVSSMPRRLNDVLSEGGAYTKY